MGASVANDIAGLLEASGLASVVYRNRMPEASAVGESANAAVYDMRGSRGSLAMGSAAGRAAVETSGFQVVCAGRDSQATQALAYSAYKKLDGLGRVTLNGTVCYFIEASTPPYLASRDEAGRFWYAAAFNCLRAVA